MIFKDKSCQGKTKTRAASSSLPETQTKTKTVKYEVLHQLNTHWIASIISMVLLFVISPHSQCGLNIITWRILANKSYFLNNNKNYYHLLLLPWSSQTRLKGVMLCQNGWVQCRVSVGSKCIGNECTCKHLLGTGSLYCMGKGDVYAPDNVARFKNCVVVYH